MFRTIACDQNLVVEASGSQRPLSPSIENRVKSIWDSEQSKRTVPMVNGDLFSIIGRLGNRLTGRFVEHRRFIAQRHSPMLFRYLRVRPLAVAGLVISPEGVVFGRRNRATTQYPDFWELVPSGGIDRAALRPDGTVDFAAKIAEEFAEETGCPKNAVERTQPFLLMEDVKERVTDIAIEIRTSLAANEIIDFHWRYATDEYTKLSVVQISEIKDFVSQHADKLASTSLTLLEHRGLL